MYLCDFQSKLKRLNPKLYVRSDRKVEVAPGKWTTAICLRTPKRRVAGVSESGVHYLSKEGQQKLQDSYAGLEDQYVGGVPLEWVPEYDQLDPQSGKILARGWRTIALDLAKKQICSLDKVRKVFSPSIGESTYDRMTYEQKLALARSEEK